ncbi:PREDICTED: glycerophosphodiester phosphodiesterase domain-containing protein 1-like [Priapulus caudatus]|uniref:Glycerophosphodiester phosphodiesterase domain-containing protein 1-like n=1 Tax=Priapulus caudatus TaxID=37621 RepID=A0ABM1DQ38_PRICU|nr:PREDICTED: glycerophosphodiester phosphodiesterase domain-containing protein 1-like [Priapulus caudatus]
MTAFEHAVSVGTDMLEIDCQRTADGHVVVAHDDDLRRLTGHDARISETRLSDLPPIRRQLPVEFMSFKHTEGDDCRIPLLREVFERFRNLPMNIDIKVEDERLIRDVSQLVREFQREHITVWGNAKHTTIQKCHRENPNIPILFSFRRVVIITFSFYIGLLPFLPMKEQFLEIFLPSIFLKKDKEFFAMNKKWRLLLWFVDKLMVRRAIFEHLDRRGVHTYLWVLNDEADWLRAERLNVTGVMTDFPSKYTQFLSSNGFGQK